MGTADSLNKDATLELSVLIVNYDGAEWLSPCLTSLQVQLVGLDYEIILVDNASRDDSLALLRGSFPEVRLIVNETNLGFAHANNQAFAVSHGRYILLVNNDTVFLTGLRDMLTFLVESPVCGAAGPAMLNGERHPRGSWGYFPTLGRMWLTMTLLNRLPGLRSHTRPLLVRPGHPEFTRPAHAVDWLSGACLLSKREVLEAVGFFDPNYFMYGEDVELCYRIQQAGYILMTFPQARIIHYGAGGAESGVWKGEQATLYGFQGFLHFYRKHRPRWQRLLLRLALGLGAIMRALGGVAAGVFRARDDGWMVARAYMRALWVSIGIKP
ncbi:MAG: glycosyltransferase family 2 protein [Anaerolineae bacterium]|jgi:hypothetical protein